MEKFSFPKGSCWFRKKREVALTSGTSQFYGLLKQTTGENTTVSAEWVSNAQNRSFSSSQSS